MAKVRKLRLDTFTGWALYGRNGGSIVTSCNVPVLYGTRKDAWYDGDDDMEVRPIVVSIREMRRKP